MQFPAERQTNYRSPLSDFGKVSSRYGLLRAEFFVRIALQFHFTHNFSQTSVFNNNDSDLTDFCSNSNQKEVLFLRGRANNCACYVNYLYISQRIQKQTL